MAISPRNARIGGATVVAALLVGGAYVLPGISVPKVQEVNAELTDDLLASYVSKDGDRDGLPDWQESLYGTDPAIADTDGDGISDGEAVRQGLLTPNALASQLPTDPIGEEDIPGPDATPGSFTDKFARTFLQKYLEASDGKAMSPETQQELLNSILADYTRTAAQSLGSPYTLVSVRTSAGKDVNSYASEVENAVSGNIPEAGEMDMITLTQRVIQEDDAAAATRIGELGSQYVAAASALLNVSVSPALAESHLNLIRGFHQAGRAAIAVSNYQKDPLLTMGALSIFLPARDEIMQGMDGIARVILASGEPSPGTPSAEIVELVRQAQQP